MNLAKILELLALINASTPGIAGLIVKIRGPQGQILDVNLDAADAKFQANLAQAAAWAAANPQV